MNLHLVPVEICRGGKSLATLRALVWLLSRVRVGVIFQQKSLRERLVADSANVLANRRVKLLVLAEIMHQEATLGALLPPVHLDLLVKLVLDRLFNFDRQQLHRSVGHVRFLRQAFLDHAFDVILPVFVDRLAPKFVIIFQAVQDGTLGRNNGSVGHNLGGDLWQPVLPELWPKQSVHFLTTPQETVANYDICLALLTN